MRWAIFKENTSLVTRFLGHDCPGYLDGDDPQNFKKRPSDYNNHIFTCMRKNIKYARSCLGVRNNIKWRDVSGTSPTVACKSDGVGTSVGLTLNTSCASCTYDDYSCTSCNLQDTDIRWYGNPGNDFSSSSTGVNSIDPVVLTNGRYTSSKTTYKHLLNLEAGTRYRFKAVDTYGDGWNNIYR